MSYTAADIMDLSASLLNDRTKELFTYDLQLPFLRSANDDLDLELQDAGLPVLDSVCRVNVAALATNVTLPCSFFLPLKLEQRIQTSTDEDAFIPIVESPVEPSASASQDIQFWSFRQNLLYITPSFEAKTIRVTFRRSIISLSGPTTIAEINKAKNFLAFTTAGLCAEYVGGTQDGRVASLNMRALASLEKLVSVLVKNTQGNRVRRRPFRLERSSLSVGR